MERRTKGRNSRRERPRTVHIDVYCTASDSEESAENSSSSSTDESNTSSCYTVLRSGHSKIRHMRKKAGLPLSMTKATAKDPERSDKRPLLSYRISTKELAEALERSKRSSSRDRLTDQQDVEELFRDLTFSDSSILRDAAGASESDVESYSSLDETAKEKSWRSPEEERLRRKMLEQRKEQWRAAKSAEEKRLAQLGLKTSESPPIIPDPAEDLKETLLNHSGSARQQISRRSSRRCPDPEPVVKTSGPFLQPPPPFSFGSYRPARPTSIGPICRASLAPARDLRKTRDSPVDIPWQFRLTAAGPVSPILPNPLKKFGRHVGPARNPDCSCAHCVEHFARLRSIRACKPSYY